MRGWSGGVSTEGPVVPGWWGFVYPRAGEHRPPPKRVVRVGFRGRGTTVDKLVQISLGDRVCRGVPGGRTDLGTSFEVFGGGKTGVGMSSGLGEGCRSEGRVWGVGTGVPRTPPEEPVADSFGGRGKPGKFRVSGGKVGRSPLVDTGGCCPGSEGRKRNGQGEGP